MKLVSFRLKIALLSALISGSVLLCFGLASWYLLYRQKVQAIDTEIRSLGTRHPGWLANRANFERLSGSLDFIFGEEHRGKVIFLVKDAQNQMLYLHPGWPKGLNAAEMECSLEPDPQPVPQYPANAPGLGRGYGGSGRGLGAGRGGGPVVFTKVPRFFTARAADSAWRLGIMGNDDLRLVVGLNYDQAQAELKKLRNGFLLAFPLALGLVGFGGWFVAGRALHPLKSIARTAEQVTARGLDQRIINSNEDPEISRLIDVLNGMMGRLEASFHQATRFSADASHELKTPLAIMQGELETAIQKCAPGSPEQQVYGTLLEQTQQLKRITSSLLLLAQVDAGQLKLVREPMNLSAELETLLEDARILAADANLRFEVEIQPGVCVEADRGLLRMALFNLIKNAVTYNEIDGCVRLSLRGHGLVELALSNTGPGIPEADHAKVFDRFFRVKASATSGGDGLGLGLSLAREIILAHRGELVLKESKPGHTCFVVSLPGCEPQN